MANPHFGLKTTALLLVSLVSAIYLLRTSNLHTSFVATTTKATTPNEFYDVCGDITIRKNFTQEDYDRSDKINDFISSFRNGNPLINFTLNNQTGQEFYQEYTSGILPFGIAGLGLLGLGLATLCCLCCDFKCFKTCLKPKTFTKVVCSIASICLCSVMIVGAGTGWYYSQDLRHDFKRASCAGANFFQDVSHGNENLKWRGLEPAAVNLTSVVDEINNLVALIPNLDSYEITLNNLYDIILKQTEALYENNKDLIVRNPIPGGESIVPDFVANLGPSTADDTICENIADEMDLKESIISQAMTEAKSQLEGLKEGVNDTIRNINFGIGLSKDIDNNVTTILNVYVPIAQDGQDYHDKFGIAIVIFFGLAAVLSILIFIGVINTFTVKSDIGFKMLKSSRTCLNMILLVIFAGSAVIFPVMIAAVEGCNTTEVALKNQTLVDGIFLKFVGEGYIKNKYSQYVQKCVYGDGDFLSFFNVQHEIWQVAYDMEEVNYYVDLFNSSLSEDSLALPDTYDLLYPLLYGEEYVTEGIEDALYTLSTYTNKELSKEKYGCDESGDTWLLNSTGCNSTTGTVFHSSDAAGYNYGNPTCMSLDQYIYKSGDRYGDKYAQCPAQEGVSYAQVVQNRVTGFQDHMTDVRSVFQQIKRDLDKLNRTNLEFMTEARGIIEPMGIINDRANGLIDYLNNSDTGLVSNLNCAFMQPNGQTFLDQLCVAYIPSLFMVGICCVGFGVIALLAMFPIYFLEKLFNVEKQHRRLLKTDLESMHNNTEAKNNDKSHYLLGDVNASSASGFV